MFLTVLIDLILLIFGFFFLANLLIQVKSMRKLIKFLTESHWKRITINLTILVLSLAYLHDVAIMLSLAWGLPAFDMVSMTYDGRIKKFVNVKQFCLINYYSQ